MTGNLGYVVSWKSPSETRLDVLREAMRTAGLDESLAKDFSPERIMKRALGQMRKDRVIHKVKDEGDLITFQLNKVAMHSDHVDYPLETAVRLHAPTRTIASPCREVEQTARRLFEQYEVARLASDVTSIIQKIFDQRKGDLIPIREQGGAYFVPHQHVDLVRSTEEFLRGIGGRLNILAVTLGDQATDSSVASMLGEYLAGRIKEFREACQDISSKSRSDAIERRYQAVAELRMKLTMYRDLLQEYARTVSQEIDSAEKLLVAKLCDTTIEEHPISPTQPANDGDNAVATNDERDNDGKGKNENENDDEEIDITPEELLRLVAEVMTSGAAAIR